MIKINNVNKYFYKNKSNQIHVINNASLDLPSVGLVALLGDSGAGKTTLLNVIGGLDRYESGNISYDDVSFNKYKMKNVDKYRSEHIGYIFQHYNLLPQRTVYDNLVTQLDIIDITDPDEQQKRIKYALTAVGLYKFRKKLAGQLSGGQMQRVAIARALVKKTKILIADEPTGNLDSKNSVEIMNILKNISSIALVLLVTHDKPLAEYYADTIVELKDGCITNIRNTLSGNSDAIKKRLDYKVYLGDMNKICDGERTKTVVYSNEENPDINLTLIEINGTYYIKSNVMIKDIEEANVELVEGKYQENEVNQIEDKFNFDASWYDDTKKPHPFKRMWHNLKEAFISFKAKNKRAKILKAALVLIGIVLAISFVNLYEFNNVATSGFIYDDASYSLNNNKLISNIKHYDEIEKTDASIGSYISFQVTYDINSLKSTYKNFETYRFLYKSVKNDGLLWGSEPKSSFDVVLGKNMADKILKKLGAKSYEELSYMECRDFNICGVSKRKTEAMYSLRNDIIDNDGHSYIIPKSTYCQYEAYDVVYGVDCKGLDDKYKVLYVLSEKEYKSFVGGTLDCDSLLTDYNYTAWHSTDTTTYTAIGLAVYKDIDGTYIFPNLTNYDRQEVTYGFIMNDFDFIAGNNHYLYYDQSDYTPYEIDQKIDIIEGEYVPVKDGIPGVIVSIFSDYEIGDVIELDCNFDKAIVTGKFKPNTVNSVGHFFSYHELLYMSPIVYTLGNKYYSSSTMFEINDSDKSIFENMGFDLSKTIYQTEVDDALSDLQRDNRTLLITALVMVAICIIYTYFTMRAHMIADIYEIGVLRNIGASRARIISRYAIQSIVSVCTTSVLGYVLFIGLYGGFTQYLRNLMEPGSYKLFQSPYPYYGLLSLFAIGFVFGTLPIFTLLGKTPSEISAKYDI